MDISLNTHTIFSILRKHYMRITPFILAVCLPIFLMAQTTPPAKTPKASSFILTGKDTLYLTIEKGEKIIHHTVKPKQTLFSICKFYSLSLEELYEYNPQFQTDPVLHVEDLLRIPTPNIAIKRYKRSGFKASANAPLCYVVQPGDNLYQICKRHFEMPVDSIKIRNKLKTNNIVPGQVIHVGWVGTEGFPLKWRIGRKPTENDALKSRYDQQKTKHKEVSSQGICMWNKDNSEVGDLYALHREAALGTTVAVTNPATKKTVYAKVIGRIPPNYAKNAEVVISPAAAKRLSAPSGEFMIRIVFLK
jgi:LysM repeat protein